MIRTDYDKIIAEHFDVSDNGTRKCLIALEDAEQNAVLSALSNRLYDKIVDKVGDVDFGSIPKSSGDITKVEGFADTMECLEIMHKLTIEYKENPEYVDEVLLAVNNIKDRKAMFMKAFAMNVEFPMVIYNLMVLAITNSVSFLISVCVQYIKDPEMKDMKMALDKTAYHNVKDNFIYEQISSFNRACASGDLDSAIDVVMQGNRKSAQENFKIDADNVTINVSCNPTGMLFGDHEAEKAAATVDAEENVDLDDVLGEPSIDAPVINNDIDPEDYDAMTSINDEEDDLATEDVGLLLTGGVIGTAIALKGAKALIKVIIPFMRNLTYFFASAAANFKGGLLLQAKFIEMNAYQLRSSSVTDDGIDERKRKKIVAKQLKVAEVLKKLGNKFAIDNKKADKKANDLVKSRAEKVKIDDLKDDIPSDIYNKSVLF